MIIIDSFDPVQRVLAVINVVAESSSDYYLGGHRVVLSGCHGHDAVLSIVFVTADMFRLPVVITIIPLEYADRVSAPACHVAVARAAHVAVSRSLGGEGVPAITL